MNLSIITPSQTLFSGEVKSVTLPGTAGLFEVLENHAPLVSSLREGTIKYALPNGKETLVEIASGFVEVCNNLLNVCVEGVKS
jgi:F-type H+-transporting ATPase subunit epsilon